MLNRKENNRILGYEALDIGMAGFSSADCSSFFSTQTSSSSSSSSSSDSIDPGTKIGIVELRALGLPNDPAWWGTLPLSFLSSSAPETEESCPYGKTGITIPTARRLSGTEPHPASLLALSPKTNSNKDEETSSTLARAALQAATPNVTTTTTTASISSLTTVLMPSTSASSPRSEEKEFKASSKVKTIWIENYAEFKTYCQETVDELLKNSSRVTPLQLMNGLLSKKIPIEGNKRGRKPKKNLFTLIDADTYQAEITLFVKGKSRDFHLGYVRSTQCLSLIEYSSDAPLLNPLNIQFKFDSETYHISSSGSLVSPEAKELIGLMENVLKSSGPLESKAEAKPIAKPPAVREKKAARKDNDATQVTPPPVAKRHRPSVEVIEGLTYLKDLARRFADKPFVERIKEAFIKPSKRSYLLESASESKAKETSQSCSVPKYTQMLNYAGKPCLKVELKITPYFHVSCDPDHKKGSSWIYKTSDALLFFDLKVYFYKTLVLREVYQVPNAGYAVYLRKTFSIDVNNLPAIEPVPIPPRFDTNSELHTVEKAQWKGVGISGNNVLEFHSVFCTFFNPGQVQLVDNSSLMDDITPYRDHVPFRLLNAIALNQTFYEKKFNNLYLIEGIFDSVWDGEVPQDRSERKKALSVLQNYSLEKWYEGLNRQKSDTPVLDRKRKAIEEIKNALKTMKSLKAYREMSVESLISSRSFIQALWVQHAAAIKKQEAKTTCFEIYFAYKIHARDETFPQTLVDLATKYCQLKKGPHPFRGSSLTIRDLVRQIQFASRNGTETVKKEQGIEDLHAISSILCDGVAIETDTPFYLNRAATDRDRFLKPMPTEDHPLYPIRKAVFEILWNNYYWAYDRESTPVSESTSSPSLSV